MKKVFAIAGVTVPLLWLAYQFVYSITDGFTNMGLALRMLVVYAVILWMLWGLDYLAK